MRAVDTTLRFESAGLKSIVKHVIFLFLEAGIATAVVSFLAFLLVQLPLQQEVPIPTDYTVMWAWTIFSCVVWVLLNNLWPFTLFQALFTLPVPVIRKLALWILLPSTLGTLAYVIGLTLVDDGVSFNFYMLGIASVMIGIATFIFMAKLVKFFQQREGKMPLDVHGYYLRVLIPPGVAVLLQVTYCFVLLPTFRNSSLGVKFVLRFIVHPLLLEVTLTALRWLTFRISFTESASVIALLVPVQFIGSWFGRLMILTMQPVSSTLQQIDSVVLLAISSAVAAIEELLLRLSLWNR